MPKPKQKKEQAPCDCCGRLGELDSNTHDAACDICAALECDTCREIRILMDNEDGEITYEDLLDDEDESR